MCAEGSEHLSGSDPLRQEARFDSADPARRGQSVCFKDRVGEVCADHIEEVLPAIRALERARAQGLHAAGFIAYEAAPGFESRFATRESARRAVAGREEQVELVGRDVAGDALPLLWFGIYRRRLPAPPLLTGGVFEVTPLEPDLAEDVYAENVRRILEWIAAGDTYQVNYTFRMRARLRGSEAALYAHLVHAQRAAYCAYVELPRFTLISASPELFFSWEKNVLELRPMKGTRPRGRWPAEDDARASELLASQKERAENLMIVDLMRNDAGRVAVFDSVQVPRLFEGERYPTVHQLTSTVTAQTRPGTTLEDVLRALFPSGSVTGAPKLRTSQIIAQLETTPRGAYTGAIGFISPDRVVFSVAIRTLLHNRLTSELELGVGSGITADSDPAAEYRECLAKAAFVHHPSVDFELLESLRYEQGRSLFLLDAHLARLAASARYFGFAFDDADARDALDRAVRAAHPALAKIRVLVARDGQVGAEVQPIPVTNSVLRVGFAREPVDDSDPFLFHKTTHRAIYDARLASRPDCDDVVLCNRRGDLTSATTGNLVLRRDGILLTPPIEAGVLAGTFRQHLIDHGELEVATLRPEDLRSAEAVYIINSVRLWRQAHLR